MSERSGFYPAVGVDAAARTTVSHGGGVLLCDAVRAVGLDRALSAALAPGRKPLATHDPAKVMLDLALMLALMLALGSDCLADVALLREHVPMGGALEVGAGAELIGGGATKVGRTVPELHPAATATTVATVPARRMFTTPGLPGSDELSRYTPACHPDGEARADCPASRPVRRCATLSSSSDGGPGRSAPGRRFPRCGHRDAQVATWFVDPYLVVFEVIALVVRLTR